METKYIDLHTHTNYSDGQLLPEQIVKLSAINGIDILAITDHDHIKGYFKAKSTAQRYEIQLIPGTEITTPNYHLLALNFNPNNKTLLEFLKYSRDIQKQKCEERIEILKNYGVPITMEKIKEEYPHSRLGKGNINDVLCKDKECRNYFKRKHSPFSTSEIFEKYLGKNGLAGNLKPNVGVNQKEAIDIVHIAGGIIGIAHPPKNIKEIGELEILVKQGIDFLETQPNYRTVYPYQKFEDFAKENSIPISYGSDYHGPTMGRALLNKKENILSKELGELLKIK